MRRGPAKGLERDDVAMTAASNIRTFAKILTLKAPARTESLRDLFGRPGADPGPEAVVQAVTGWILRAQARSVTADGGVAAHYSLRTGWSSSYPETTGYIVPTLLAVAARDGDRRLEPAVRRMLDWLVSIQFGDGSFQGGNVDAEPRVPVVFNTGQILFGLAAGVAAFGAPYAAPMAAAGDWLLRVQDADGAWRQHRSPFTSPGPKTYETHVAWALLEADRVRPGHGYAEAALRNIGWALTRQQANGWFDDCCLGDPRFPLTHTIGYVLRGVIEGWRHGRDPALLAAAVRTADSLVAQVAGDGRLAGRLDADWRPACPWVCMTGSSQIAHCLILLAEDTGTPAYLATARALNSHVRRRIHLGGDDNMRGGVKGSFPTHGGYGPHRFLNWAAKFTIDANMAEAALPGSQQMKEGR
jgi:hypothetical protein